MYIGSSFHPGKLISPSFHMLKFTLFLLVSTAFATPRLQVSQSQIDSLDLPFTLVELIDNLEPLLKLDASLQARKWAMINAFYAFQAAKKELELLERVRENTASIHALLKRKRENAEIDDISFYQVTNDLLSKEISVLKTRETCRSHLLVILQGANVEITQSSD